MYSVCNIIDSLTTNGPLTEGSEITPLGDAINSSSSMAN